MVSRSLTQGERDEQLRRASLEAWGERQRPFLYAPDPEFDVRLLLDKPRPVRMLEQSDIACPAGIVARAGRACLCRIENHELSLDKEASSLQAFCLNREGYVNCPSKQDDRRRHDERRESLSVRA